MQRLKSVLGFSIDELDKSMTPATSVLSPRGSVVGHTPRGSVPSLTTPRATGTPKAGAAPPPPPSPASPAPVVHKRGAARTPGKVMKGYSISSSHAGCKGAVGSLVKLWDSVQNACGVALSWSNCTCVSLSRFSLTIAVNRSLRTPFPLHQCRRLRQRRGRQFPCPSPTPRLWTRMMRYPVVHLRCCW